MPASLNKGLILRHHFSKFGKVKQVRPVPAKRAATIQFESHVSWVLLHLYEITTAFGQTKFRMSLSWVLLHLYEIMIAFGQ